VTQDDRPPSPAGLRVGYVLTHYPRLAQTFISGEIDAVRRAGVRVETFAMNEPSDRERKAPDALERIAETTYLKPQFLRALKSMALHFARHPLATANVAWMALASAGGSPKRMIRRLSHLLQAALVADACRRNRLDYLHAQFGLAPATIAWLASALHRTAGLPLPFGFTIHGFHDFVDPAESRLELKARDAAQVLCVSDFTRSQLCLLTPPELWNRFTVARCGIDLSAFPFRVPAPAHGLPTVLAVGRLSPEKGFEVLLDALAILRDRGTQLRLVLVGDGPLRSALEGQAMRAGLSKFVEFEGELAPDDVRKQLDEADMFCLPSLSEGLPISIMEAMAVGVPVVTTWVAGIPELAVSGVTALTVPPGRVDALAIALDQLAEDEALRLRIAKAARCRVEEFHDQARCGAIVAHRFAAAARS
jgi:colanic acid/amylovoran biosynthesis glycosyltransferase